MTALAERTIEVTPQSVSVRAQLEHHARKRGKTVADLADDFANEFFNLRFNTHAIARRRGLPEAAVYNALHRWREAGR